MFHVQKHLLMGCVNIKYLQYMPIQQRGQLQVLIQFFYPTLQSELHTQDILFSEKDISLTQLF